MRAIARGTESNLVRFLLKRSDTGAPMTGLAFDSAGLAISTIVDVEAAATAYSAAGGTIETVATLGTYAAPTAGKCRFREVDSSNHPGLYEFQFADARFAVANSHRIVITVQGVADLNQSDYEIQLSPVLGETVAAEAIVAALEAVAIDELPIGTPPKNPNIFEAMMLGYMRYRNGGHADRSERGIANDNGQTIAVASVSYQGSRAIFGKLLEPTE